MTWLNLFQKSSRLFDSRVSIVCLSAGRVSLIYTKRNSLSSVAHIDSDLASEMIMVKKCVREKSLVPRGLIYGTEMRLINMQILAAYLFTFISSWNLIRVLICVGG